MTATVIIDVELIDDMLDSGLDIKHFDGQILDWHGTPCPLTIVRGRLRAKLTLMCHKCGGNPETVLIGPGLHNGAWPYVFDTDGHYVACLRDEVYVCDECAVVSLNTARLEAEARRNDDDDNRPQRQPRGL